MAHVAGDAPPRQDHVLAADHGVFPSLDGLRAIAALGVLITHVGFMSYSNVSPAWRPYVARADVGVAVFFALSGFLLGRPFLAAVVDGRPGPSLRSYFRRRLLRIYPLYWIIFAVCALGLGLTAAGWGATVAQLLLVQIYRGSTILGPGIIQKSGAVGRPLGPAWSLAVEISFYAFLPLLAAVLARLGRRASAASRWRTAWAVVVGLALLSLVLRLVVYRSATLDAGVVGTWLPLNFDWFAVGMGLALLSHAEVTGSLSAGWRRLTESPSLPIVSWGLAALSFVAVSRWVGLTATQLTFTASQSVIRQVLYASVGLFMVLPCVVGPRRSGLVRRTLAGVPLRRLGAISYGLYLWQDLVIDQYLRHSSRVYYDTPFWRSLGEIGLGTVAISTASYWLVERPAQRLGHRRR